MKIKDIVNETTSAGGVAAIATPVGGMLSRQMKNPDGTVKNALDMDTNIMGGPKNKKKSKKA
jgi:predicted lactoylglutathione lyase